MPPGDSRSPSGGAVSVRLLERLRARLAVEGLHVVLPLDVRTFDSAVASVGGPAMSLLLDGASGAYVVGDGGPEFFTRFRRASMEMDGSGAQSTHPLDLYTRRCVDGAVAAALNDAVDVRHRIVYPFDGGGSGPLSRPLPFQRLGRAAGLPAAGPLGIQVHPRFGPWWAYRALILVAGPSLTIASDAPVSAPCDGCAAPCAAVCPGEAVAASTAFAFMRCADHRLTSAACATSCAARLACPIGAEHRYPDEQLAFHMTASLIQIRAFVAGAASA